MSGHDSKYFSTTKKGEIPELKEELNSQYKVCFSASLSIYLSFCVCKLISDLHLLGIRFFVLALCYLFRILRADLLVEALNCCLDCSSLSLNSVSCERRASELCGSDTEFVFHF